MTAEIHAFIEARLAAVQVYGVAVPFFLRPSPADPTRLPAIALQKLKCGCGKMPNRRLSVGIANGTDVFLLADDALGRQWGHEHKGAFNFN